MLPQKGQTMFSYFLLWPWLILWPKGTEWPPKYTTDKKVLSPRCTISIQTKPFVSELQRPLKVISFIVVVILFIGVVHLVPDWKLEYRKLTSNNALWFACLEYENYNNLYHQIRFKPETFTRNIRSYMADVHSLNWAIYIWFHMPIRPCFIYTKYIQNT